jgi:RNA polymerase sigma-70 factor (family 1)
VTAGPVNPRVPGYEPRPPRPVVADGECYVAVRRSDHPPPGQPDRRVRVITDDRVLLAQMRAGEGSAFAALFRRYYGGLCAFASGYTKSRESAEEVVEDVFVRLWELREQLEVRETLKSYLFTAVRNRALNRARDERAELRGLDRALPDSAPPGMGQLLPALDEELEAAEFLRAVEEAVAELPPRTRQVFTLHRQHGLTYAEIGTALLISPKTVENLLGRALKQLRERLAPFLRD